MTPDKDSLERRQEFDRQEFVRANDEESNEVMLDPTAIKSTSPEFCICAAIIAEDGRIFRGHRHDDALITAGKNGTKGSSLAESQGFITSTGRFVDRVEGARLQTAAGIVSVYTNKFTDLLFSEDLY